MTAGLNLSAAPAAPVAAWTCRRRADLSLRHWPDGWVLFDEAQGQMKYLTLVSGELLALLLHDSARAYWSACELARALMDEAPSDADVASVTALAGAFESMQIIERCPV